MPTGRNRLLAISLIALLVLGGAAAGVVLRPAAELMQPVSATADPATLEAVRQAASLSDAFTAIAAAVTPAVVRIEVERTLQPEEARPLTGRLEDLFGRPIRPEPDPVPQLGGGTGFIVSADGYILTNNHVIAGADRITVQLRDKRVLDAQVIGADPTTDVAVIKVAAGQLPVATLGDSEQARVGEWVLAVGNPGFSDSRPLDFTVTGGIISAKNRPLDVLATAFEDRAEAQYAIEDFIQTDAVINPGNSGGPLIDLRGTVIGINTAIATTSGYSQGYGFAIPSNLARRVMRDLIAYGYVRRPLLGISIADVSAEDAEVYRLPAITGVVIEDFSADSPAGRAGLRRHDVITAIDGVAIERVGQLQRVVAMREPGDLLTLAVVRYGETREFRVRVVEAPGAGAPAALADGSRSLPAGRAPGLGLELEELTALRARQLGYEQTGGALIARVLPATPASRKAVGENHRVASIDGEPIESVSQARSRLRSAESGQVVSLLIARPDGSTYIANLRMP